MFGLKVGLVQMEVVPGRPDLNAEKIIREIQRAEEMGVDILAFPELCVSGYLLGDKFADTAFVRSVEYWNSRIVAATSQNNVVVIFGTVEIDQYDTGEDGRPKKFNCAVVAQQGRVLAVRTKTLHPNYRYFNDGRHFFSQRQTFLEIESTLRGHKSHDFGPYLEREAEQCGFKALMQPVEVQTRLGVVSLGVLICEDIWHEDYAYSPYEMLYDKGAELFFCLSASPWGWGKNNKRHRIVKQLMDKKGAPLFYVNNIGVQPSGKNVVVFDGCSAYYDQNGDVVFEVPRYRQALYKFLLSAQPGANENLSSCDPRLELWCALSYSFQKMMPVGVDKVVVGASGGVDSALMLALATHVVGAERVVAVNMPSQYNSQKTQDLARLTAENLGIEYRVVPIETMVRQAALAIGVEPGTLAYENIQPRVRMNVLATIAQSVKGVFTNNGNKVEMAYGYATLYGDMAGFYCPFGDLLKREIYQMADYVNSEIFGRVVIPEEVISLLPTAELASGQTDPFDYGNLERVGYDDALVKAFTEFHMNPEDVLVAYRENRLESLFGLPDGHLGSLYLSAGDFVRDLRRKWVMFSKTFFKRIQSPPILVTSRAAFGSDFLESMTEPYFTPKFLLLEQEILELETVTV